VSWLFSCSPVAGLIVVYPMWFRLSIGWSLVVMASRGTPRSRRASVPQEATAASRGQ
jgi:hypothetical protein